MELSQAALRYKVNKTTAKDLLRCLEQLSETLPVVSRSLDAKLADYIFFPLSHVFSESNELPPRLLEHALTSLRLLIRYGWKDRLSSDLGKQLLILLAFLAGGTATDVRSKHVDEDVATIAFDCIASLFCSSVAASLGSHGVVSPENIPLLGHAVTVILHGVSDSSATKVRLAACTSLNALIEGIEDGGALRNFFPGIISCLTKLLSSGIRSKPPWKLLHSCIQLLDQMLHKVLSDSALTSVVLPVRSSRAVEKTDQDWVKATASQVKVALSTVMPLRYHDRQDVTDALFLLGFSILADCRTALQNCTPMILETLVTLASHSATVDNAPRAQRLQQILASSPDLFDILKDSLYDWTVALPRVVTSNDEMKQTRMLEQLSTAFRLLSTHDIEMKALHDLIASSLQCGVASAIQMASTQAVNSVASGSVELSRFLQSATPSQGDHVFAPVVFNSINQGKIMSSLQRLIRQLKNCSMSTTLQRRLTQSLKSTISTEQIATLWLMLELIRNQSPQDFRTDQWLQLPSDHLHPFTDGAYSFSLEILDKSTYDDAVDWRLQALSLEVVAFQAQDQGQGFRPELVDALYPILERMGSSNAALQQHAVTCLSIVSNSCGYASASELVIDNADYLVNAVAVKLNTFDISPQASQVMLMMVRLCGSTIIPYLDDLIETVFAILACYHGYPRLVESLFEVLNAIVDEGGKSSPRAIASATHDTLNPRRPYTLTSITKLVARLQATKHERDHTPPPIPSQELDPETTSAPKPEASQTSATEEPPPRSKTHTLIHTITQQTTHHLSTPSFPLRRLLLTLIATSLPALRPMNIIEADDDPTFLPLIATLWPHVTRQIFSPSSSSPASATTAPDLPTLLIALQTLTILSQHSGSFLLSRFSDLLPQIQTVHTHLEQDMLYEEKTLGPSRASRTLKFKAWDTMVGLVAVMVEYVGITREMEDGVFVILGGEALMRGRQGVRGALEGVNPDALWLLEEGRIERKGQDGGKRWESPVVEGWEFMEVEF